jgi:hypothetical protein
VCVVGGGDGSFQSVVAIADRHLAARRPLFCPLPLGTGNELARVTGWGRKPTVDKLLEAVAACEKTVELDDWAVTSACGGQETQSSLMCFWSCGYDARIALRFHERRERDRTTKRTVVGNKLWHVVYGAQVPARERAGASKCRLQLTLARARPGAVHMQTRPVERDRARGRRRQGGIASRDAIGSCAARRAARSHIALRNGSSAQVCNIHSTADGNDLWKSRAGAGSFQKVNIHGACTVQRVSSRTALRAESATLLRADGLLEVIATTGVRHLSLINMGCSSGIRLGVYCGRSVARHVR